MKTLKFTIRDKHITRQDGNAVVAGAVNHYELECAFDEDWDGLTKTVVLENGDVKVELLYTGGLTLPWEVCREGGLLLSVRGTKTLGDGRTQVVRTARMAKPIPVEPGGSEDGEAPSGFTPELAQQVLAVLGDLAALLTKNKSTMVAAINEIYQEAGIESIRFKETDAEGNNVYTVNLSRGESYEIKAPIGKTGPQGAQGIKGDTGQKGDKGEKGEKGDRGEKGDTGATGAKGDKGDPGATGPQGITPTIGENENWYLGNVDTGKPSRGRQGEKGEKGEKGETGAKGEKGDSGVYVGAGDMPEGYNVQIDPSGSGDEIVTAESIESALGYTPADSNEVGQIKEDIANLQSTIAAKMDSYTIKTVMDSVATPHTQYYLGNQTAVDIVLPDTANVGQIITVCWYNGETAATLSITGTMLNFDYTPGANSRSEINALWDGRYWAVLGNEMAVPSEVTA